MKAFAKWLLLALLCVATSSITTRSQTVGRIVDQVIATTCTNQLIRNIAASGAGTCATVANADMASMTTSTIKGQTVGGSGAPVDLTAAQAAAVIGSVGGALKSKIILGTRDLTVATGSVAYTGMGFQPTSCVAFGSVAPNTVYTSFFGASDSTGGASAINVAFTSNFTLSAALMAFADAAGTNLQTAAVSSYDADGLTLSWTKTGTPTGTASFRIMCFR